MKKVITLLVFILFCMNIFGQSLYNHGAIISIKPNTILSVYDSLVNDGEIINNGNLVISGTWLNNQTYDAGQGLITFNSTGVQIINHNDQSFSRLTISGGGEKKFLANITIDDQFVLDDGVLTSENGAKIIFKETAQITGGSDASHVHGPVYHHGAGDKIFPMGNGSVYLPVELLSISGSAPEIGITGFEIASALKKSSSLTGISSTRYWQIDKVSGSLDDSHIILPVRGEGNLITDTEKAVVAQALTLQNNFENLGQSFFEGVSTNGKVTSEKVVTLPFVAAATALNDGLIVVYNAVSPNGDGQNEYFRIENIEKFPGNKVSIFNRWGDKVFEITDYDNDQKVFRGKSNSNKDLVSAMYFYVIDKNDGSEVINGYLSLKTE